MSKLVSENHAALHATAKEVSVENITSPEIQKVLKDMRAALRSYNVEGFTGVAIAAPQIGVSLRIFLVEDMSKEEENDEERIPSLVAINPEIINLSKKKRIIGEGCLSVPEHYGAVAEHSVASMQAAVYT